MQTSRDLELLKSFANRESIIIEGSGSSNKKRKEQKIYCSMRFRERCNEMKLYSIPYTVHVEVASAPVLDNVSGDIRYPLCGSN